MENGRLKSTCADGFGRTGLDPDRVNNWCGRATFLINQNPAVLRVKNMKLDETGNYFCRIGNTAFARSDVVLQHNVKVQVWNSLDLIVNSGKRTFFNNYGVKSYKLKSEHC